jgi:hypothetical protein
VLTSSASFLNPGAPVRGRPGAPAPAGPPSRGPSWTTTAGAVTARMLEQWGLLLESQADPESLVGRPETRRRKLAGHNRWSQCLFGYRVSGVEFAGGPLVGRQPGLDPRCQASGSWAKGMRPTTSLMAAPTVAFACGRRCHQQPVTNVQQSVGVPPSKPGGYHSPSATRPDLPPQSGDQQFLVETSGLEPPTPACKAWSGPFGERRRSKGASREARRTMVNDTNAGPMCHESAMAQSWD